MCSRDVIVILTNGYGQLFSQTLNDFVIVHNGRTAGRGRRRECGLGTGNGKKYSGTRLENADGKVNRERGWVEGNSERDWGNLGNSELDQRTKAGN